SQSIKESAPTARTGSTSCLQQTLSCWAEWLRRLSRQRYIVTSPYPASKSQILVVRLISTPATKLASGTVTSPSNPSHRPLDIDTLYHTRAMLSVPWSGGGAHVYFVPT